MVVEVVVVLLMLVLLLERRHGAATTAAVHQVIRARIIAARTGHLAARDRDRRRRNDIDTAAARIRGKVILMVPETVMMIVMVQMIQVIGSHAKSVTAGRRGARRGPLNQCAASV